MEALPLKEILASLLKEFEAAGVAADVSREHWRQVYESNSLLKEFSPSRIRITEATVSLPLALAQISTPRAQTPMLTSMQLLRLLPATLPLDLRGELAEEAAHYIQKTKRMTFANRKLARTVVAYLAERVRDRKIPDFEPEAAWNDMAGKLDKLREDFLNRTNQNPEREALFSYQTEELLKMGSDKITRFDLKIAID
ncbi:MAG: hypothetical protein LWW79_03180 [Holophagaceae bacterium]|nr:hypothetical protein [Holophagaceae bacterium]